LQPNKQNTIPEGMPKCLTENRNTVFRTPTETDVQKEEKGKDRSCQKSGEKESLDGSGRVGQQPDEKSSKEFGNGTLK